MAVVGSQMESVDRPRRAIRGLALARSVLGGIEGAIGTGLVVGMVILIIVGPLVAPRTSLGAATPALGPSGAHPLGTDALGRDVLSRLLDGGRTVLALPAAAMALTVLVGGGLGLTSAYLGGWFDGVVMRFFDLAYSLPPLLIVLVVIAALGPSDTVVVLTVAAAFAPAFGRVVRAATQSEVVKLYVAAARVRGEGDARIIVREIVPNIVAPALAELAIELTYAILFVASLSFLGLGVQPPAPDWGLMVSENRDIITVAPLACLAPALAITLLAVGFSLLADSLTKAITHESPDRMAVL